MSGDNHKIRNMKTIYWVQKKTSPVTFLICGFCMEIWGAACLTPFDVRDLGVCRFGDLHEEKRREGVLQPIPQGYWGTTVMSALDSSSPFPTYPSSSIFLPSLSPTASFKAHSTCSGPYCSDGVKEQSRQWRTVDIIMLLVTVSLKHLVLKVC